ncbi:MAG: hypothetical protein NVSMB20_03210 [Bradyrhizobium sp.]
MTDRTIIYSGQVPLETDLLQAQVNQMVGLGYLAQATMGTNTFVEGLALGVTSPTSMQLIVGPGVLGYLTTVDATAFSSVAASGDPLMKLGINRTATTLAAFAAPTTAGQSQNYLVQMAFSETDAASVALPYFNAANPSVSWSGPNNSGTPQFTSRQQRVIIGVKAGTPAVTGSQTTPPVDAGYTPMYIVTVPYGAATLTASNFTAHPQAPFVAIKLPALRPGFSQVYNYSTVGTATFTVPNNVSTVWVRVWGGGGGGGGSSGSLSSGGGGGGGAYSEGIYTVTPGAAYTVTVGASGSGGAATPTAGGAGGTSSFGSLLSAAGGNGGGSSTGSVGGSGGTGGAPAGGNVYTQTGNFGSGAINVGVAPALAGPGGGTFCVGNSQIPSSGSTAQNGINGSGPGGGGSGGVSGGTGGQGSGGLVLVGF